MTTTNGLRAGLMTGAGVLALTLGGTAMAATPDDNSDARIAKLEAAVAALEARADHEEAVEQENTTLKGEVTDLQAQVVDLKSQQTAQTGVIATIENNEPAKPTAVASIAGGRPTISSADGKFTATLHGVMQLDTAAYAQNSPGPLSTDFRRDGPALGASTSNVEAAHARDLKDGDVFRRARIGIDGTAYGDWDYRLIFDFAGAGTENAGQLYETWVQYSGLKPFHVRVGAFSPSIGMEDQASTNGMPFLERSVTSDLARGLAAGDTRTAAELWANGDHWLVSGAVTGRVIGVINTGTATAVPQSFGDQLGLVGRAAISPFHGDDWLVHFGVNGSYVVHPADTVGPGATNPALTAASEVVAFSNTPELRVDGAKLINTGNIDATHAATVGLEFAAQKANFLIQSEYDYFTVQRDDGTVANPVSNPSFHGYYVEGLWTLTGEQRKYNASTGAFDAPAVAHPFDFHGGGWGAWEVGLRFSDMDLNYDAGAPGTYVSATSPNSTIRGGEEQNFTAGLNWYLNPVVRFMLDYSYVHIDRLSPATAANSATTWLLPTGAAGAGVQIGQNYSVVAVRSQVAF